MIPYKQKAKWPILGWGVGHPTDLLVFDATGRNTIQFTYKVFSLLIAALYSKHSQEWVNSEWQTDGTHPHRHSTVHMYRSLTELRHAWTWYELFMHASSPRTQTSSPWQTKCLSVVGWEGASRHPGHNLSTGQGGFHIDTGFRSYCWWMHFAELL